MTRIRALAQTNPPWLPSAFCAAAALPQILRRAGIVRAMKSAVEGMLAVFLSGRVRGEALVDRAIDQQSRAGSADFALAVKNPDRGAAQCGSRRAGGCVLHLRGRAGGSGAGADAVDALCGHLGIGPGVPVLDLAAGTGKLTRTLVGGGVGT
mgnify:CR=1 FL=1